MSRRRFDIEEEKLLGLIGSPFGETLTSSYFEEDAVYLAFPEDHDAGRRRVSGIRAYHG
jgi:hypothetical protein